MQSTADWKTAYHISAELSKVNMLQYAFKPAAYNIEQIYSIVYVMWQPT